jgi:hypothetical protein
MRIMITLNLRPLNKKLHVVIVRKMYDEPWSLAGSFCEFDATDSDFTKPSLHFSESLKRLVRRECPDLVTEERGMIPEFKSNDVSELILAALARKIPYRRVDIDEYARAYLAQRIELKASRCAEIKDVLRMVSEIEDTPENRTRIEKLSAYFHDQQSQLDEEAHVIEHTIRERWIAKGILDEANQLEKWKLKVLHLCSPRYEEGLSKLLESLDVEITHVSLDQAAPETSRLAMASIQH